MTSKTRVTPQELRKKADELENLNTTFLTQVSGLREDEATVGAS